MTLRSLLYWIDDSIRAWPDHLHPAHVCCQRRSYVVAFAVITGMVVGAAQVCADAHGVRYDDPVLAAMMAHGRERSPTFRRLLARLEKSDLIVQITRGREPKRGSGFTQFIVSAGGYRYVRITLNVARASDGAVALLGHELHHAAEVADEVAVRDAETYHELYRTIGYVSCPRQRCYDTAGAVQAGWRVLDEVQGGSVRRYALDLATAQSP